MMTRVTRSSTLRGIQNARTSSTSSSSPAASKEKGKIPPFASLKAPKAGVKKPPTSKAKPVRNPATLKKLSKELHNVGPTLATVPFDGDVSTTSQVPVTRPASPTATNAPLVSPPRTAKLVSYPPNEPAVTAAPPSTTTDEILKEGIEHLLKVEPKLAGLIQKYECNVFSKERLSEVIDPFRSLISSIIAQQVSGAAANSIKAKFIALFEEQIKDAGLDFPTPRMVLDCDHPTLRTAGLSLRKAEYVHSLSEHFLNGELSAELLIKVSDEEVVEKLTKVRGLGVWSAEMFLFFALKRMDVFSTGDLGIQRGMAAFMGRDVGKLKTAAKGAKGGGKWKYMSEADMIKHSEKFRPYRSLFMWYMWKASDTAIDTLSDDTKPKKPKATASGTRKGNSRKRQVDRQTEAEAEVES
ncbi:3-methyladenine DNA glycosylase [Rhizina undulata]